MKWIGVIAAVAVVSACGGAPSNEGDADGAQYACEQYVTDRLKSPSTATFSDQREKHSGRDVWTARGSVDSQNSFGAMIREDYICVVKYLGGEGESYKLVSIDGL